MPDTNEKVLAMVREAIETNPDVSTTDLYERAKKMDKEIGKLTPRQFNARYPLQVKRRMAPARRKPRSRARRAAAGGDRAAVRAVLQQLAQDVAGAESGAELVAVIGNLDDYVERVIRAAGAPTQR